MDLGLLGGLAQGLQSGVQGYQTERAYQQDKMNQAIDRKMKQQTQQSALIAANQDIDPSTGQVRLNDLGQQKKQAESAQTQNTIQGLDKNSEQSRNDATTAAEAVNRLFPGGEAPKAAIPANPGSPATYKQQQTLMGPVNDQYKLPTEQVEDQPAVAPTAEVPAQPGTRMGDVLFKPGQISSADVQRMQKEGFLAEAMKAAAAQKLMQSRLDQSNINNIRTNETGVQKATIMGSTRQQILDEKKNQNSVQTGKDFEHDPIIKLAKTNLNGLTKAEGILNNPNKPLIPQDLTLAYNDYINSVTAGGAATEGKIHRELPVTWATDWETAKQKVGKNDDIRKNTAIAPLIMDLKNNITQVRGDMQNAVSDQAKNIFDNYETNTNQKVQEERRVKLGTYSPQHYKEYYGQEYAPKTQAPGLSAAGGGRLDIPKPQASTASQAQFAPDVLNYAKVHNITPEAAQAVKVKRGG